MGRCVQTRNVYGYAMYKRGRPSELCTPENHDVSKHLNNSVCRDTPSDCLGHIFKDEFLGWVEEILNASKVDKTCYTRESVRDPQDPA